MTARAAASGVDLFARSGISGRHFFCSLRADALDEGDQLPGLVVIDAGRGHLRAANAVANGRKQIVVGGAVLIFTGGQIGAAPAVAGTARAVGAVGLKSSRAVGRAGGVLLRSGVRHGEGKKSKRWSKPRTPMEKFCFHKRSRSCRVLDRRPPWQRSRSNLRKSASMPTASLWA